MSEITAESLKSLLTDALLSVDDALGVYLLSNSSIPAISILPHPDYGYSFPPPEIRVSGNEVVIIEKQPKTQQLFEGQQYRNEWDIFVKRWDTNGDINSCIKTISETFVDSEIPHDPIVSVPPADKLGILAQSRLTVYQYSSILKSA